MTSETDDTSVSRRDGAGIESSAQEAVAEETMAFLLRLRAKGVSDLGVLRALETAPRPTFAPHRYADLAWRDMALPIPCGQTMSEPFALAKILEAMKLEKSHRILEIGTGSGYSAALMAKLAGQVTTVERFRTLSLEAKLRLRSLDVTNVVTVWGDGLDLPLDMGLFDRILVDGAVSPAQVARLLEFLAEGGVFVGSIYRGDADSIEILRISHESGDFSHASLGPSRAAPLIPGASHAL
jgi:protein-L-isoaspartate(D-aspartate) O-methyltransferase